jgi:hypothetical protein
VGIAVVVTGALVLLGGLVDHRGLGGVGFAAMRALVVVSAPEHRWCTTVVVRRTSTY